MPRIGVPLHPLLAGWHYCHRACGYGSAARACELLFACAGLQAAARRGTHPSRRRRLASRASSAVYGAPQLIHQADGGTCVRASVAGAAGGPTQAAAHGYTRGGGGRHHLTACTRPILLACIKQPPPPTTMRAAARSVARNVARAASRGAPARCAPSRCGLSSCAARASLACCG